MCRPVNLQLHGLSRLQSMERPGTAALPYVSFAYTPLITSQWLVHRIMLPDPSSRELMYMCASYMLESEPFVLIPVSYMI